MRHASVCFADTASQLGRGTRAYIGDAWGVLQPVPSCSFSHPALPTCVLRRGTFAPWAPV